MKEAWMLNLLNYADFSHFSSVHSYHVSLICSCMAWQNTYTQTKEVDQECSFFNAKKGRTLVWWIEEQGRGQIVALFRLEGEYSTD